MSKCAILTVHRSLSTSIGALPYLLRRFFFLLQASNGHDDVIAFYGRVGSVHRLVFTHRVQYHKMAMTNSRSAIPP